MQLITALSYPTNNPICAPPPLLRRTTVMRRSSPFCLQCARQGDRRRNAGTALGAPSSHHPGRDVGAPNRVLPPLPRRRALVHEGGHALLLVLGREEQVEHAPLVVQPLFDRQILRL